MKKSFSFDYEIFENKSQLSTTLQPLIDAAFDALKKSYAPYSNFKVGAAALMSNQKIINGANQENASYSVTCCAERTVLAAVTSVYNKEKILAMAITYLPLDKKIEENISPCGVCRQAILEFEAKQKSNIDIYLCSPTKEGKIIHIESIKFLLPFYFGQKFLK